MQKGIKDIVKIVHVTSVVQPSFYEAMRIYFVCEENKNNNFIQQFIFFCVRIQHTFKIVPRHLQEREEENEKYSRSFITLQLNHWCHMDYFKDVFTIFLGLERVSSVAVYAGSESSRISSKIS